MPRRPWALPICLALLGACSSGTATAPSSTGPADVASTTCTPPREQRDVAYLEPGDPKQRLDLYVPADAGCDPLPVVVWVHGGGWRTGDKRNAIDAKVALWTAEGWAVASVNYRLSDAAVPEAERLLAPAHNEDVAAAIGWLVDHADDVGIDPDRIALLGHSAGAGIVAALAADPTYLEAVGVAPTDLGCVAPLDTEAFDIAEAVATGPLLGGVYEDAFGTDPARWADLSPLTHVGDAAMPDLFLVARGGADRRAVVASFRDAVEAAGGDVTVVDLPSFTHEDVSKRIGDPSDTELTPALQDFLSGCLA